MHHLVIWQVLIVSFDCRDIPGINTIYQSSGSEDKVTSVDIALMEGDLMVTLLLMTLHCAARMVPRP